MKQSLLKFVFILLAIFAMNTYAKGMGGGGSAGRMPEQGMGMRQGGNMDRDQTRLRQHQQTPGQYQDGSQQQFRDMNREQNQFRQMAPGAYQDGNQQQFREMNQQQYRLQQMTPAQ